MERPRTASRSVPTLAKRQSRVVGHQPRHQPRQFGLAFGHPRGAKQAALLGIVASRSVLPPGRTDPTSTAAPWVRRVLEALLPDDSLKLVNVNLPREPQGPKWTRQSVRQYDGAVCPGRRPDGKTALWLTVRPIEETEEGTDLWAVREGYVSLTPLRLDLTDHAELARVGAQERKL